MNDCYGPRFEQSMHIEMSEASRDRLMYLSLTEIALEQQQIAEATQHITEYYDNLVEWRKYHWDEAHTE